MVEAYVSGRGHICVFYPKFYCDFSPIGPYWNVTKISRVSPATTRSQTFECLFPSQVRAVA